MMTPGARTRIAAALQAEMATQQVTATQLSKAAGVNPRTVKRILEGEPAYDHNIGKVATTLGWGSDRLAELLNDRDQSSVGHTPEGIMRGYRNVLAFAEEARYLGASAERIQTMTTAALDIVEDRLVSEGERKRRLTTVAAAYEKAATVELDEYWVETAEWGNTATDGLD